MLVDVVTYLLARLLLVAALSVVIFFGAHLLGVDEFPLVLAVLFAIVIALPLGIWVFSPLRRKATASIAAVDERRKADKAQLRSRLQGDEPPAG
jgi:ABC-type proline/glycine betaine transport system permease subunit